MLTDSEKSRKITVAIECESIEHDTFGVARLTRKLLEQLKARPELARTHRFILYFNSRIPADDFLDSPLFEKRFVGLPRWGLPVSFSIYYYVLLPIRLWFDRPNVMYWPNYMLPLIATGRSLVMLTEDIGREMHNPRLALRYRLAYRIFTGWAARHATRIMAISHSSKGNLMRLFGIASERIAVNELAVDAPHPVHGPVRTNPYLLYVGQAFERRHLRETLMAFERLASAFPGLQFVVVGPDKYQTPTISPLAEQINARLGRQAVISFAQVPDRDLHLLYAHAQAIAYISAHEGFGLPPLEALSYGTPAVVADTSVSREIFGNHAFFVKNSDVDGIEFALKAALTDTGHRQAIKQAAENILDRYTWTHHTERFLRIIDDMTASTR